MTGYYAAQVVSSHSAFSASPRFTFISIFQPASRRYRGSETRPFAVPVLRRLTPRQSLPFCQVNACGSIALNRPTRSRTLNARKSCRLFDGSNISFSRAYVSLKSRITQTRSCPRLLLCWSQRRSQTGFAYFCTVG